MNATQNLPDIGRSLWLDNITRTLLANGTLKRYIDELCVTGLTSNPTIFHQALKTSSDYDADILYVKVLAAPFDRRYHAGENLEGLWRSRRGRRTDAGR